MERENCMVRSLEITELAMDALRNRACLGVSERDVEGAMKEALENRTAQWDLMTGERTALIEGRATDRLLKHGDPILLDLSVRTGGWWTDVCRTFFLGDPGEEVKAAYRVVVEAMEASVALLRPGVEAQHIHQAVARLMEERGMRGMMRHHTGHGVGREPFQPPVELPGHKELIREGDVMTVEIGVYEEGAWGVRLEDIYVVESSSPRPLWRYPLSLSHAILEVKTS